MTDSFKIPVRRLGKTGLMVSELCLGAMTFGQKPANNWGMPTALEAESIEMLNTYASYGGNFIDTADVYGESEIVIGNWLKTKKRDDFIIATKVRGRVGPGPNDVGLSRKHIMKSVETSLQRLGTDYIDLYQVHSWDIQTPLEETFRALDDLVRAGKVRYVGVSNFQAWQLQKAIDLTKQMGWEPIVCLQPQYNLVCRYVEWDLLQVCELEGVGVIPWSPLAGGILSGRYTREKQNLEGSRVAWAEKVGWKHTNLKYHGHEQTWDVIDTLTKIAKQIGKTEAQVALRWLLQKPGVTAPIIGAKNVKQLVDNINVVTFKLTDEQMEELDKVSQPAVPYPWGEYWTKSREISLGK